MTVAKLTAYSLLIVGTTGLLINEFAFHWGTAATLTFAVLNALGLATVPAILWNTKVKNRIGE